MLTSKQPVSLGVLLVAGALLVCVCSVLREARAASPHGEGRERDEITELKKRVTKLEAEVEQMRKALLRAGGGATDNTSEIKKVREAAKLRSADLLQRAQNTHAILREVMNGRVAGRALQNKINDLNNDLTALWLKVAGYGLGRDPYLERIQLSDSGSSEAKLPPDYGIRGPYVGIGLPRLHERFLEASGVKGRAAEKASTDFKKLVQVYSNPAVYQHRDFYERAYGEYREGKGLFTPQYVADLKTVDRWLTDLEAVLGKVPGYFDKAP
jgi:cell division septum initiation protein DivIVA